MSKLPVQDISNPDNLTALLAELDPQIKQRYPSTIEVLTTQAAEQLRACQKMTAQTQAEDGFKRHMDALDLKDPRQLLHLGQVARTFYRSKLFDHADFMEILSKTPVPTTAEQQPLPDIEGLTHLVEYYKSELINQLDEAKRQNPNSLNLLIVGSICQSYAALFQWDHSYQLSNCFHNGVANQATNILRTLMQNPADTYYKKYGYETITELFERMKEETTRINTARLLAQASPEQAHEALAILRRRPAPR